MKVALNGIGKWLKKYRELSTYCIEIVEYEVNF